MKNPDKHIDSKLISRLNGSDVWAYEKLFDEYAPRLFHFSMGYLGSHQLSEEIVQDVFLKIWEKRKEIKAEESFKSYLFTIAFNLIRKYFLKKSREEKYKQLFAEEFLLNSEGVDEKMAYEELLLLVDKTIDLLPERRREIFILSRKEGLSIAEIAEKLDISPKTVKNQLTDAIQFIRGEIKNKQNLGTILFCLLFVE